MQLCRYNRWKQQLHQTIREGKRISFRLGENLFSNERNLSRRLEMDRERRGGGKRRNEKEVEPVTHFTNITVQEENSWTNSVFIYICRNSGEYRSNAGDHLKIAYLCDRCNDEIGKR